MSGQEILQHKNEIHIGIFIGFFVMFFLMEMFIPRRPFLFPRKIRTTSNLFLAFTNNILLQFLFPVLALGASYIAVQKGWGLFAFFYVPPWLEILLTILLLDLIIYGQHIAFHLNPLLWRLHRVHHADLELDVSTGIRFHPIEIFISMGIKIGSVILIGASPLAVFLFEILLMSTAMFNHSNLNLPLWFDGILRQVIITPDVHRVHHSIYVDETNSNYGFNFVFWDRLFGTFHEQPRDGHVKMKIGINFFRSVRWLYFHRLIVEPFISRKE